MYFPRLVFKKLYRLDIVFKCYFVWNYVMIVHSWKQAKANEQHDAVMLNIVDRWAR